ncbi:MAG: exodeoxyribonuclease VII large subunit, partial [Fusobacteriaceae bacterium]|nr:exodeoxyribonuclease VII large subunit [Fusobacteriaceae bacterium]
FLDSKKPIVSAVGHEIDVLLTDFIADARAATPTHASEMVIPRKEKLLEELYNKSDKIKKMMENRLKNEKNKLNTLKNTHAIKNFSSIIEEKNRDLVILEEKMNYLVNNLLDKKSHLLELKRHRLLGVNPKEVLKRGYTITLKNGKVVKDKNTINNGDEIESYFYNGAVKSIVKE